MTEAERLAERLEAIVETVGHLPLCNHWMYSAIRHCQRNMDFDFKDGFNEPNRQCGGQIADLVNMGPEIAAALRSQAEELERLRRALRGTQKPKLITPVAVLNDDGSQSFSSQALGEM